MRIVSNKIISAIWKCLLCSDIQKLCSECILMKDILINNSDANENHTKILDRNSSILKPPITLKIARADKIIVQNSRIQPSAWLWDRSIGTN